MFTQFSHDDRQTLVEWCLIDWGGTASVCDCSQPKGPIYYKQTPERGMFIW